MTNARRPTRPRVWHEQFAARVGIPPTREPVPFLWRSAARVTTTAWHPIVLVFVRVASMVICHAPAGRSAMAAAAANRVLPIWRILQPPPAVRKPDPGASRRAATHPSCSERSTWQTRTASISPTFNRPRAEARQGPRADSRQCRAPDPIAWDSRERLPEMVRCRSSGSRGCEGAHRQPRMH